jgi:hypothetical protein
MMALIFEAYGALCFFALVVFLAWAAVAKLRPDLDEEVFDLAEFEKVSIVEEPSRSPPARPVKPSKAPIRRRPHLFHTRKPHTI